MIEQGNQADAGIQSALEMGTDLAGSVSGAAVGFLIGGPPGAIAGAIVAPVIKQTLVESMRRIITRREKVRVATTLAFTIMACEERLNAGAQLRQDGFFEPGVTDRSAADEVAEAVVVASERSFEERKTEYLGYLLANIAFAEGLDRWLANRITRTVERLSWSQLVILGAAAREDITLPSVVLGENIRGWISWAAHQEAKELLAEGYLTTTPDRTPRLGLSAPNRRLAEARLGTGGVLLVDLMWLKRIPDQDIEAVLSRFGQDDAAV
jgi:hypothetical protein